MLRMMNVEEIRENIYQVTLDRDGKTLQYEFTYYPKTHPNSFAHLGGGGDIDYDLIDYEKGKDIPPDRPNGAIWIPVIKDICRIIVRYIREEPIEFPILLDER